MTHIDALLARAGALGHLRADLCAAADIWEEALRGGKLLLCGNGGSYADCEHIAGELLKGFLLARPLSSQQRAALECAGGTADLADKLQGGLPAVVLGSQGAITSAAVNDLGGAYAFAQQAWALGRPGDALVAISTSGNAQNVRYAAIAARARGMKVVGMTGETGGALLALCDVCLRAPDRETYLVQEHHIMMYHALCAQVEADFFGKEG